MCNSPITIVVVLTVLLIGFALIVISVATPFWQEGGGYDVGLFSMCKDGECKKLSNLNAGHYLCVVLLFIGLLGCAIAVGIAIYSSVQRYRKKQIQGPLPNSVPVVMTVASSFLFIGGIVYCFGVYDDDKDYSLSVSPWLLFSGIFLLGVGSYFFQWTFGGLFKVSAQETQPHQQQQNALPAQNQTEQRNSRKVTRIKLKRKQQEDNPRPESSINYNLSNTKPLQPSYDSTYQIGYPSLSDAEKPKRSPGRSRKKKRDNQISQTGNESKSNGNWSRSLDEYVPAEAVQVLDQQNTGSQQVWYDDDGYMHPKIII